MNGMILELTERAKLNRKRIILPESEDIRVVEAAKKIAENKIADVILIGNRDEIETRTHVDLTHVKIIDNLTAEDREEFAQKLYELRKEKGMTQEQANTLMDDRLYYGVMMVKLGLADGLVSGAAHSTANTLKPALQIIKTSPEAKCVSSFFMMAVPNCEYGSKGRFIFSDAGLIPNPTAEELAEIAYQSSVSFNKLIDSEEQAKVAMLSYSTKGSAKRIDSVDKVLTALELVKEAHKNLLVDGELQLDAAIDEETAKFKAPESEVAGKANVLIFPNLDAGNIGYKLVQRLAKAEAYGPITQGLAKPINDLSRGCSSDDIVGAVAITALQAE